MTRINVVPPEELCDQHLLAEHRELTRIPSVISKRNGLVVLSDPGSDYCLGRGHVRFFYNHLGYLLKRYKELHDECLRRNFNVTYKWAEDVTKERFPELFLHYSPTRESLRINRERILVRMPKAARFTT